jgi:tetratricopeptide (TPR) repeat protein/TolB-like protein
VALAPRALGQSFTARYTLERELGRGGMATVYLARDLQESQLVALKLLRPEVAAALGTERFLREIRLTGQLQHPHILGLLDSGEVDGGVYYTMPCVGESLRACVTRQPQLPIDEAIRIATEVAQALAYAHGQGVIHRDIKPENILLEGAELGVRAVVADFGVAQALSVAGGERLTATGLAVGTPAYMSPEQASGSPVDQRSDLYSLGCVLYEMLGGEPPYTGPTGQAILAKRVKEPIPHLRTLRPEIPESVEHAVTRALAKSPADRFPTVEQFATALAAGPAVPVKPAPWRARRVAAIAALVLFIAAALATAAVLRRHPAVATPSVSSASVRRIVVAVFQNQTGDSSLDPLGDIVSDYLARGLAETRLIEVIDARAEELGDRAHPADASAARALGRAFGAGSVLWGTYVRQGDDLRFEAQLADVVTGKPSAQILPALGPARQPTLGVEALRQHVMVAVAARLDPQAARFEAASRPSSYEAYQEFLTAEEIGGKLGMGQGKPCPPERDCDADVITHYRRAFELDTSFTLAIIEVARMSPFEGRCDQTDSIAEALRPRHDRLPAFDRADLDMAVAACHGQLEKVLRILREAMAVTPRSDFRRFEYAWFARATGHFREAIAVTEKLDRNRHEQDLGYWDNLIRSYHMVGEHQDELELGREARLLNPGAMKALVWEASALVALRHVADVNRVVDEMIRIPEAAPEGNRLSAGMDMVGRELRAHGYRKEAQVVFDRAIRWNQAQPAAAQRDGLLREDLGWLLYDAGRWDEARAVLKKLAVDRADDIDVQGRLGAVAARLSEFKEVARIDRWLAERKGPYLHGVHTFRRAALAAILGDRDRAVELYGRALEQGYTNEGGYLVHYDPDFESLRDYPPFQELTRPKD